MRLLPLLAIVLALPVAGRAPQETHPSTPGLTSAEALIELDVPGTMKRANEALLAANLTLHKPMPQTIGASNEHVFALINADQEENGKVRVIVSVASNPAKRGEAPRVCNFLIEYMKTGKAPAAGLNPSIAGVWEWNFETYTGPGKSNLTFHPNGDVTSADPGWPKGTWWTEGSKICVYWPSPFPKENRHYVNEFELSADGRSMKLTKSDYYYKSVTSTRVGDAPAANVDAKIVGVWAWSFESYVGPGKSDLTFHANGDVTSADPGWSKGTWWKEGAKVCVYWPSPFPKENRHYVNEFEVSADGLSMKLSKSDYYYKSVTATRKGDITASGTWDDSFRE